MALNIVGFGIAPLAVGALSDSLTLLVGQQVALQQALLFLVAPSLILAACFVTIGARLSANAKTIQGYTGIADN
jgi:hypothetical protein